MRLLQHYVSHLEEQPRCTGLDNELPDGHVVAVLRRSRANAPEISLQLRRYACVGPYRFINLEMTFTYSWGTSCAGGAIHRAPPR